MKKAGKIVLICFIFLILLILGAIGGAYGYVYNQIQPVTNSQNAKEVRFEIKLGTSNKEIAENLKAAGLIKNSEFFYYATRKPQLLKYFYFKDEIPESVELKGGIYYVKPDSTYLQLLKALTSGQQEFVKVSIPEGLTISQIGEILEENEICTKQEFKDFCYNQDFVDSLGIKGKSLEGYLFPDTYFLNKGISTENVAELFVENFKTKVATVPGLENKSLEELKDTVILASIVEKEYRVEDEAPLIASVFKNRLRLNWGLYSCATVVYIITEIHGRPHPDIVTNADTKDPNEYNTYVHAGLTPGPISNPGLVALNAAANPADTNYFFFQVIDPAAGRHVFTKTLDEHNEIKYYTKKSAGK